MSRVTRRLWAAFWVVLALLVIVLALVVTAARLMLPEAGRYRPRVEQWASTVVGRPVKISRLRAEWKGIRPAFRLYDVRLLNRQGDRTRLRFSQVRVTIAPLASLLSGTPTPSSVSLTGARLSIQRRADGGLSVAGLGYGAPNGTAPRAGLSPIEALLLGQRRIALESSEIVWQDLRRRAAPLRFTGVNLTLHNDGDRHRLEASATLPASLGQRFKLAMDVTGDVNAPKGWSGTLDVEGSALHMAQWLRDGALKPVRVLGGAADLVLHSRWRQGRLEALRGDVALRRLRVETTPLAGGPASSPGGKPAPPRRLDLAALSGNFTWQRAGQGWRLQVNHFALTRDGRTWPSSAFSLAVGAETAGIRSVSGEFDYLQLQDVAAALQAVPQLPAEVRRGLTALRPHGELRGVKFSYLGSGGLPERFSVQARFQGLATRAWHKIPAVQGLAGRVQGDQHSGTLVLNSRKVRLEFPRVFRAPLNLDQLAGDVRWRSLQGGLLEIDGTGLQAGNRDVRQVKAGLRLEIPGHGAPPRLDMLATFAHGDVAGVFRYLPVSIMPKPSVEWLDRALVSGRVRSGEVVFRGPVTDFPFDNGRGQFEVGFNLHDTVLAYRPGWPSIQGMKAHVLFSGRSMVIDADAGTISGAAIKRVHAAIPDLQHPVLSVQGTADGPVQNMLQFLRESPLASHYSDFLRDVTATGNGALNLDMRIPLSPEPNRIKGAVQFSDNALTLKRWGVDFTDLDGMLDFNESGVSAQSLSARYRGYPVRIAVDTLGPAGQRTTRIDVDGRLSVP
ncbi:MAG: hypothetical protein KGJ12_04460, partial [Gammaproteobacteria bacterium]|nr:hypothetical protein [Gammaproteobacteria bacterium]